MKKAQMFAPLSGIESATSHVRGGLLRTSLEVDCPSDPPRAREVASSSPVREAKHLCFFHFFIIPSFSI